MGLSSGALTGFQVTVSRDAPPHYSRGMAGTVVMIVILAIAPVLICMSGVVVAAVLGRFLKADRDAAFEGTEQLEIANRS